MTETSTLAAGKGTLDPVVGRVRCILNGAHDWQPDGGRQCPRGDTACSQTVYRCARCGAWDYGEAGGPSHAECEQCSTSNTRNQGLAPQGETDAK
jgi:hypothetical protein